MKGIYVIKQKQGDDLWPVYVGKSLNIYNRWGEHLINYPYDQYKYEVCEIVDGNNTELLEREQHWIDKMNTLLEGDNKMRAVKTVETRGRKGVDLDTLPPILKTRYPRKRVVTHLQTFKGESCIVCGEPTERYLIWYPYDQKITALYYRYGEKTKERKEALDLIDECKPVCRNCIVDKEWGEEKAPF
ncbi:MAG: GIY-YIG nuclease family protein [Anaerolineales bacterium]|jgi:hypothetical protein|nr:GIY-YIG nuclease family protein [Anaerolineales bacterium]MDP6770446.1 GIY-YIG nuclease family protein [Anaerolineales bacterium]|tara:strand:- start:1260 stop:1820 length:561 start_codon:yes stop_codon:yes gene_type:complete